MRPRLEAVEVLAEERGAVAGVLQPVRQPIARRQSPVAAVGARVGPHAVVVGLLPGQQGGPRRAAPRVGGQALVEGSPRPPQQPTGAGHPREVGGGHVVGHDQHDVGPRVRCRARRRAASRASPLVTGASTRQGDEEQREQDSGGHGAHAGLRGQVGAVGRQGPVRPQHGT